MAGPFGVRRPLRVLAHKLELDEEQIGQMAAILDDLKMERAQRQLDERRTQKLYAEAIAADSYDLERAKRAASEREAATRRVQDAIVESLAKVHAMLDEDQRRKLVTLLRAGQLSI